MLYPFEVRVTPRLRRLLAAGLTIVGCTLYVASVLPRGWIPHDEGQLGHTAERILSGELPHRDFIEPYTGGLGYLHALAFHLGGVHSGWTRWVMLPLFVGFVASVYWIASRVAPVWVAVGVAALCTCLTLPVYPAGMPSWYNLFLATCGTAALMRHIDTGRAVWLWWAGFCGGLSILAKITGLYFVAAVLLYLVYFEQEERVEPDGSRRGAWAFSAAMTAGLACFAGLGFLFLRRENRLMDVLHFVVPFFAVSLFLVWREWRGGARGPFSCRLRRWAGLSTPCVLGVAAPVVVFMLPYVASGSCGELWRGLFVLPARRMSGAQMPFPDIHWLAMSLPLAALLASGLRSRPLFGPRAARLSWLFLAGLLMCSHHPDVYRGVIQGIRHLLPLLVLLGVATLVLLAVRRSRDGDRDPGVPADSGRRREIWLLTAAALLVSLIQFPYSSGYYFFYAAPPGVLLALYLATSHRHAPRRVLAGVLVFLIAFLVLRVHHPGPSITGGDCAPSTRTAPLGLARCGFTVREDQARLYRALIARIQAHSERGEYIFATPDCPEVYFLSNRRNPTRTMYEFLDAGGHGMTMEALDRRDIKVVVLKQFAEFSGALTPGFESELERRYPNRVELVSDRPGAGEAFVVLWRS